MSSIDPESGPVRLVTIIHPDSGNEVVVPESSLPHHFRAGWRLLTDDEAAEDEQQDAAGEEPPKMSRAQAKAARVKAQQPDAPDNGAAASEETDK